MEYFKWKMIEATGWTKEYVDALPLSELHEWLHYHDGKEKAATSIL